VYRAADRRRHAGSGKNENGGQTMSGRTARNITGRIVIVGRLVLETPAHFGNGDVVGVTDMPLLRDPRDGVTPLLTGASIAGALRSHLREIERGYGEEAQEKDLAEQLFGRLDKKSTLQSWLLVDDALGVSTGFELRDGVAIDTATRTAEDKKKFDIELLAAGTAFDIRLEFLETKDNRDLLPGLATTLDGLTRGQIGLGQRKRRGYGRCRITEWRVRRYNLTKPEGLLTWLDDDGKAEKRGDDIFALLDVSQGPSDKRNWFRIEATFGLPNSLLIRSSSGEPGSPDMLHLKSRRRGELHPIVPGTSLAGAVRSRAFRIAKTVLGQDEAQKLIDSMFGHMDEEGASPHTKLSAADRPKPVGSRVVTEESLVSGSRDMVESRVKIDRFTGGAFPTALFSEQPVFGGAEAEVKLTLTLRNPKETEMGLLLLVLKDLWTGDLPLGGESSVGRGRLAGRNARVVNRTADQETTWELGVDKDGGLTFGGNGLRSTLEDFVAALWQLRREA
ncbi:MAG: RAMP superfamily CRISPR-associated protein, partial [Anaerolineae bacterium]